jgi:hypothetical protein
MASQAATGPLAVGPHFLLLRGLVLLLALGFGRPVLGQAAAPSARPDSTLVAVATRSLGQQYAAGVGYESGLYNGPLYTDYVPPGTQGHRFFGPAAPQPASLTYAGHAYEGVPLRYDLLRDQLVLTASTGNQEMTLVPELVSGFVLDGHVFTHVSVDSSAGSPVRAGFYEVLVAGPVRLLAAHHKALQKRSSAGRVESEITASNAYFVEKNGQYYAVEKAGALLGLFPEHKAALRQYSRTNHLSFRPDARAEALAALVRYEATLAGASH